MYPDFTDVHTASKVVVVVVEVVIVIIVVVVVVVVLYIYAVKLGRMVNQ